MKHLIITTFLILGCSSTSSEPTQNANIGASPSDEPTNRSDTQIPLTDVIAQTIDTNQKTPEVWHEDCPEKEREQRLIDVGKVTLNVACRGSGPTVVFLHGFPEFHYSWNKVMNELADEFRLVAPDQRGYNISDKPTDVADYKLPLLTQDIVSLLPLISAEPVILVAHDWGGPVGWLVAHTPNSHVRGFVSTNGPHPVRFVELIENDPKQTEASSYMAFFRTPAAEAFFTEEKLTNDFKEFLSADELTIYRKAWTQPGAITGGLNWYRANVLTSESVAELMKNLSPTVAVPTTVMWGKEDTFVLPQNAEKLETWVPDLKVETFPGVDHWIEHRIPKEVARVIRELHQRIGN